MFRSRFLFSVCVLVILTGCKPAKITVHDKGKAVTLRVVAILPFRTDDPTNGLKIADSLQSALAEDEFILVDRKQLVIDLNRHQITVEQVANDTMLAMGKLAGVDALVVGNAEVSHAVGGWATGGLVEYVSRCTARIIDAADGSAIAEVNYASKAISSTPEIAGKAIAEAIKTLK